MSGHVTYACSCLNVKLHLANKYYLDGHEKFRKGKFVRMSNPSLCGWKFSLGMQGVIVEYKNLVRMRHRSEDWVTVSCHNCKTGDVYSVKRPNLTFVEYPIDTALLSQFGDEIIIHDGTIFGPAIDNLKKNVTYSTTFHVVLNPDLPVNHEPLDKKDTPDTPEIDNQYKELKQMLKKSLIELEEATEKRIQAYQAEQELLLIREKEKAVFDSNILWQTMKEVAKTFQEEQQQIRRLSLRQHGSGPSDHTLFNQIAHEEQVYNPIHIEEPPEVIEQRRRSSAIRRDLLGGQHQNLYHRRPSYVLDESSIMNSFKNTFHHHLEPMPEQQEPSIHQVHPLANPSDPIIPKSTSSSSWEDEDDASNHDLDSSKSDKSDELFALDEDIDEQNNLLYKRHSIKYMPSDDEEDTIESDTELQVPGITETTFATSVPIHVPLAKSHTKHIRQASSMIEKSIPDRRISFVGFDYAAADRRQSLKFSPVRRVTDGQVIRDKQQSKLQEGPMVPPHIMAANTASDEAEAYFGSVPRNSIRHRPLE